ncbi:MAG: beta-phosphoglucomutase [Lachnospiraceae bacterium]
MKRICYIGTWAESYGGVQGGKLLCGQLDETKMNAKFVQQIDIGHSVSFLCEDEERGLLFAVLETREVDQGSGGLVLTFLKDEYGKLEEKARTSSYGAYPIAMVLLEEYAVVLNHGSTANKVLISKTNDNGAVSTEFLYDESSLILYERNADGTLGKVKDIYTFQGKGEIPFFQESASPHSLTYLMQTEEFYIPCRGSDEVVVLKIDKELISFRKVCSISSGQGYGPRNVVFNHNGTYCYLMHEIEPIIKVFKREQVNESVEFEEIQEIRTVFDVVLNNHKSTKTNISALHPVDLIVHKTLPYLYVLTRCSDTVSVFQINEKDGRLTLIACKRFGGTNPRQLLQDGSVLYVVSQGSKNILKMIIEKSTGIPNGERAIISEIDRVAVALIEKKKYKGIIFDLDGVICHTDELHYQAWREVAKAENITFNKEINNRLRGVSRMDSLEIILEPSSHTYSKEEKVLLAEKKNQRYVKLLDTLSPKDVDANVIQTLECLKKKGFKIAIGSSSRNALIILKQLEITPYFDAISDGNQITRTKPDPEVFLLAAKKLGLEPTECLVVEDAEAGINAGIAGGFDTAAIGDAVKCKKSCYNLYILSEILNYVS